MGVTASETRVAPLTVSGALPTMLPRVALMLVVPADTPVAVPAAVIVATDSVSEAQTTSDVIICVVLSLNVPVALKFCFVPGAMVLLEGVTVINVTVALVTVRVAVVLTDPSVAVIVVVPAASPLATPLAPPMVALVVSEELQVTRVVKFRVPPSLKVPVATSLMLVPWATEGGAGVIDSDARFAAFTVNEVLPLTVEVALIVAVPRLTPLASPLTVIDAIPLAEEAHVTVFVMS